MLVMIAMMVTVRIFVMIPVLVTVIMLLMIAMLMTVVMMVMSVNPGFGGQSFIDSQYARIAAVRDRIERSGRAIDLEVDGGITPETAPRAIAAGADALVAGTATFKGGPARYAANIAALRAGT